MISGNPTDGVRIESDARDNKVQGNWIGTDESGALLGNGESGVEIDDGAQNRVGATSGQNLANVIAHNGDDGVTVESGDGNAIVRNSIHDNGGLGIDLGADGTTANDGAGDDDAGPNTLQNGPEIDEVSTARSSGSSRPRRIRPTAWSSSSASLRPVRQRRGGDVPRDDRGGHRRQRRCRRHHRDRGRGRPASDDDRDEAGRTAGSRARPPSSRPARRSSSA